MRIYHNPRCRKSREALNILKNHGYEPEVVLYLEIPPSESELKDIVGKIGGSPAKIVRREEKLFKEEYKGRDLTDDQWYRVLADNPKLIQRPIIVNGDRAVVARPPERVEVMLQD